MSLRLLDVDPGTAVHPNLSIPINVMFGDSVDALRVNEKKKMAKKIISAVT